MHCRSPPSCYACSACPPQPSAAELRRPIETLAKRHHPDVGGDASGSSPSTPPGPCWVIGRSRPPLRRRARQGSLARGRRWCGRLAPGPGVTAEISAWLRQVYGRFDRLLSVDQSFPAQLQRPLSRSYDDDLMATFCDFSGPASRKLEKVVALLIAPCLPWRLPLMWGSAFINCFSQVQMPW